jgi:hypothetical protein
MGAMELYQAGSEGPQWWLPHPDPVRGHSAAGILDRCTATRTCPKVIEHFGSAEVWALKLTPEWVGADAQPICRCRESGASPITSPVRPTAAESVDSTAACPVSALPKTGAACPGNNFGNRRAAGQSRFARANSQRLARAFSQLGVEGRTAAAKPLSSTLAKAQFWPSSHKDAIGFLNVARAACHGS